MSDSFRKLQERKPPSKESDAIQNRNSWLKVFVVVSFTVLICYKIATAQFVFRFADFISLFLALFSISLSLFYYSKVKTLTEKLNALIIKIDDMSSVEKALSAEIKNEEADEIFSQKEVEVELKEFEEEANDLAEVEKKKELQRIEWDKTQILEELFLKAKLQDEEKDLYREKIVQKENEAFNLKQELTQMKGKIQQVVSEKILRGDPQIEKIVHIVHADFILKASFDDLNEKLHSLRLHHILPQETITYLEKAGYVDGYFNVTRAGYREFIKYAKKMNINEMIGNGK
ncbi:hypothetical protein [Bacillus taeanensis]|uniref:Uncharacterized protein n=1 Tax=Bacillus taeanensis TaxID=273032 RepID=A0A366XYM8_9BACI|nr:hypothetical protein [Bacillus taeanensis]RBW71017.1 hypothetical protein DS031_03220 [Bacillus taeanensis]